MVKAVTALMFIFVMHGGAFSQTISPAVVNSTGGSFSNNDYSLDWSIGEMALVNEFRSLNSTYTFTNGFLQPLGLFPRATGRKFADYEIRILPNPTRDNLQINFQTLEQGQMRFVLHDISGQILYTREFVATGGFHSEKINMTGLSNGTYTLYIVLTTSNSEPLRNITGTYKILKLN